MDASLSVLEVRLLLDFMFLIVLDIRGILKKDF